MPIPTLVAYRTKCLQRMYASGGFEFWVTWDVSKGANEAKVQDALETFVRPLRTVDNLEQTTRALHGWMQPQVPGLDHVGVRDQFTEVVVRTEVR